VFAIEERFGDHFSRFDIVFERNRVPSLNRKSMNVLLDQRKDFAKIVSIDSPDVSCDPGEENLL